MRRKRLSRVAAVAFCAVMAVSSLAGCAGREENTKVSTESTSAETAGSTESEPVQTQTAEGEKTLTYPVSTDVELSFYIKNGGLDKSSAYVNYSDVPFYAGLSERTGVKIDWQTYAAGADQDAAYNLMLQEEKLPNIIFGDRCNDAATLCEDGLVYDLTEYLPEYAPDFWEYINRPENEANRKAITTADGRFLYFPFIRESDFNITYTGPVIRKDWLEELNLEAPVTLEDWETVLTAFKEKYNAYFSFALHRFASAGIGGGAGAFAPHIFRLYLDNNEVKCANTQEEWKNFLTIMNRWYDSGLLDPDFTTADDTSVRSRALNGETGVVYTAMSQLTNFIADAEKEGTGAEWVGFSYPRTQKGAATTYIQTDSQTFVPYMGAMITTSGSEEELIAAIEFLNYGYSKEGMLYWNFGEEGVSYDIAADGHPEFNDRIKSDERGLSEALKDYTGMYAIGVGIQMADMVKAKNSKTSAEAVAAWTENTVAGSYMLPPYARTEEEQVLYNDASTQLSTYVTEMALKFITGEESLDNFDKFVEQMNEYGLQKLLESEQTAYNRSRN